MSYISDIFSRADIQKIRGFLLHGAEETIDPRPYKERIERANKAFIDRLRRDYPNERDLEEIAGFVYNYVSVTEDVYMEIGLQIGASLAVQSLNPSFERE